MVFPLASLAWSGMPGSPAMPAPPEFQPPPEPIPDFVTACLEYVRRALKVDLDFTPETLPLLDHYVTLSRDTIRELLALAHHQRPRLVGVLERRLPLVQPDWQRLRRPVPRDRARWPPLHAARVPGGARFLGATLGNLAARAGGRIFLLLDSLRGARGSDRSAAREIDRERLRGHGVRP